MIAVKSIVICGCVDMLLKTLVETSRKSTDYQAKASGAYPA